ncbi:MAG TPA: ABC transporter substrate-binding protein [Gemmatimonadaceae bacterium]|nr:ABC transporter substrate-binding protein [Gemmatimonadaceae bacterium]
MKTWLAIALVALFPAGAYSAESHRIGVVVLPTGTGKAYHETFRAALRKLGYVEGKNLILDARVPDAQLKQLPAIVEELIALKPDVLVGWEPAVVAMHERTKAIPIVLRSSGDPAVAGIVKSLARPGTNITGITQLNELLPAKHIELMREILPGMTRVGMLVDHSQKACVAVAQTTRKAAEAVAAVFTPYDVEDNSGIERAFAKMRQQAPDVLLPCPSALLFSHRQLLFDSAIRLRVPLTSFIVDSVPDGVLFAHAANLHDIHRRLAVFVDKILKGARPEDLPIERPTKFELVINLKVAKALGLTIPQSVLLRADRVIE